MTTFDSREKAFEKKFVHDEEMAFKAVARRNKMLGFWAADKLGKKGQEAERYAKAVALAEFERSDSGDTDIAETIALDFMNAKLSIGINEIRAEMEQLLPIARRQITGENS
jgi:hypothetical protein